MKKIAIEQKFATILIEGTGRACDAVGELVHLAKKHSVPPELAALENLTTLAVEGILCFFFSSSRFCLLIFKKGN